MLPQRQGKEWVTPCIIFPEITPHQLVRGDSQVVMLLCPCKRCWNTARHVQPCGKSGKNGALGNGASRFALLHQRATVKAGKPAPEKRMLLRKGDKHCLGLDEITLGSHKNGATGCLRTLMWPWCEFPENKQQTNQKNNKTNQKQKRKPKTNWSEEFTGGGQSSFSPNKLAIHFFSFFF